MATAPRQLLKRFRHEGGPQAPPFRQRLDHIFEKRLSVGRLQGFGVLPIDFELTIGVLVIILIRPPPQEFERVANLSNQVELSHQSLLVITGLNLIVMRIGDRFSVRRQQKELALDPRS